MQLMVLTCQESQWHDHDDDYDDDCCDGDEEYDGKRC